MLVKMFLIKDESNVYRFGVTVVDYMFEVLYTVPVLDTWMHVSLVYRGPAEGEGIRLYVDGLPAGDDTSRNPVTTTAPADGRLKISKLFEGGNAQKTPTTIDELLFWNRQLSQAEITAIKNLT